jgi:hypothetical protein
LDHPILELSTNAAENAIRPVALGRKNWIHFGSQEAGPRIAAILSIVETCRRVKIPIRDYLASILPGLAELPVSCCLGGEKLISFLQLPFRQPCASPDGYIETVHQKIRVTPSPQKSHALRIDAPIAG